MSPPPMNSAKNTDRVPTERLAEAAVWITRLHSDDRDKAMEAGFREWLNANPDNARAFELHTEVWEDTPNLRRVVPFAHDVAAEPARHFRFPLAAAALAAGLAAVAAVGLWTGVFGPDRNGVSTRIGEQRFLALEDGSRVFLNTATKVEVHYGDAERRIELKSGEALFDVAKDVTRPFIVRAGNREVRALGTSFVVRQDGDVTAVTLVEGKVAVSEAGTAESAQRLEAKSTTVSLTPGQRVIFERTTTPKVDTPSLDTTTAWRRGQVVLDGTPLSRAVEEMNRYNAVKLVVRDPEVSALPVDGLFQAGDSMSFASAVAMRYGLQIIEGEGEIALVAAP